jgi:hypothetical protein
MVFPAAEREAGEPEKKLETALREGSVSEERWRVRKDGSEFWSSGVLSAAS